MCIVSIYNAIAYLFRVKKGFHPRLHILSIMKAENFSQVDSSILKRKQWKEYLAWCCRGTITNIFVQFCKIIYFDILSTENYSALLSFKDQTLL